MEEEVVCNGTKARMQVVNDKESGKGNGRKVMDVERICVHYFLDLGMV
jgi:hypothetical protein